MGLNRKLHVWISIYCSLAILARNFCTGVKIINGCPEHFARMQMHCTTIVMQMMPFAKAETACKEKASLMFTIKDQATFDQLLNSSPVNASDPAAAGGAGMPPLPGNLMMGLKYTKGDNKWTWADGTFYTPGTDWAMWTGGAPPTPNKDGCVVWKKKGKGVAWDLADCGQSGMTICYTKATSPVQTCPDRYMQEDDLCIMPVMKLDSSYVSGSADCKAAGDGTVAMLKKESEFSKIKSLGGGMLNQLPVPVWMGLKFTAADGKWKWSDGEEYHMGTDWGLWREGKVPPTPTADTCVTMMKGSGEGFDWNTDDCNAAKGLVVCAKKATDDPTGASKSEVAAGAPAAAPSGGGGGGASASGGGTSGASSGGGGGGGGAGGGKNSAPSSTMTVMQAIHIVLGVILMACCF